MPDDNNQDNNNARLQPNNDETGNTPENKGNQGPPEGHPRWDQVMEKIDRLESTVGEKDTTISNLTDQMDELRGSIDTRQSATGKFELTVEEEETLNRIDEALRKNKGYMTKDDYERSERQKQFADSLRGLATEFPGGNGLPRFKADDVTVYAKRNGFGESSSALKAAFKEMHTEAFDEYNYKQRLNAPTPPNSEKPTGGDRELPTGKEVTPEQINKMSDQEYANASPDLLKSMKDAARQADRS